jgi:hypothetical protein
LHKNLFLLFAGLPFGPHKISKGHAGIHQKGEQSCRFHSGKSQARTEAWCYPK